MRQALLHRAYYSVSGLTVIIARVTYDFRYAQNVANTVQFIALITVLMSGLAVLLCGIVVVGVNSLQMLSFLT